jgi:LPXTG-motif cell wall-anchored protein
VTAPRIIAALVTGTVFGFGLAVAGVLDPSTIRNFLDFFGAFDPRLGLVFAGALLLSASGYLLSRRRKEPALGGGFAIPAGLPIDRPLVVGSALFGVGWGMVGLCPGPAIAGLALGLPQIFIFTISMLVGIAAHDLWLARRTAGEAVASS